MRVKMILKRSGLQTVTTNGNKLDFAPQHSEFTLWCDLISLAEDGLVIYKPDVGEISQFYLQAGDTIETLGRSPPSRGPMA